MLPQIRCKTHLGLLIRLISKHAFFVTQLAFWTKVESTPVVPLACSHTSFYRFTTTTAKEVNRGRCSAILHGPLRFTNDSETALPTAYQAAVSSSVTQIKSIYRKDSNSLHVICVDQVCHVFKMLKWFCFT